MTRGKNATLTFCLTRSSPIGGEAKRRETIIRPKAAFCFDCFLAVASVVSDVISGANVGQVSVDGLVKFGDSGSNGSRDIQQQSCRMRHFRPFFER